MAAATASNEENVFLNTVCFRVELGMPGTYRRVRNDQIGQSDTSLVKTDADPNEVSISKDILGSDEFAQITAMDGAIRQFVLSRSLNARKKLKVLAKGVYLVPDALVKETDEELQKLIEKRHNAIDAFIAAYPRIREDKRKQLGSLFDEKEFPDASTLRTSFRENMYIFNFGVPGKLENLNKDLFHRESQKVKLMWDQAANDIRDGLREGFAELVGRMATTLGRSADGKKKRFHESTVEQFMEFLDLFNKKDITNDAQLQELVKSAQEVLKGSPREIWLRAGKDDGYRRTLKENFDKLYTKIEGLAVSQPRMVDI